MKNYVIRPCGPDTVIQEKRLSLWDRDYRKDRRRLITIRWFSSLKTEICIVLAYFRSTAFEQKRSEHGY